MMRIAAELHCHTCYSDGSAQPEDCVRAAGRKGLKALAITDHNTAEGALPFWQNPLQDGVLVIPGEEVSTELGHLLVFFIRETIQPGPFERVLAKAREQNALVFAAHPVHIPLLNSIRKRQTCKYNLQQMALLDGLEVENGHNRAAANQMAWEMARAHARVGISGSDAHFPFEIGNARTLVDVAELTHESVYIALKQGQVQAQSRKHSGLITYLWVGLKNRLERKHYSWKEI